MLYLIFFRGLPRTGRTEPTESKSRTDHPFGRNMFLFWALVNYYSRHVYILARARTDVHTAQGTQTHANPNKQSHKHPNNRTQTRRNSNKHKLTITNARKPAFAHKHLHTNMHTRTNTSTHTQIQTQTVTLSGYKNLLPWGVQIRFPFRNEIIFERERRAGCRSLSYQNTTTLTKRKTRTDACVEYLFFRYKKSYFCEIDSFYLIYI